MYIIMYMAVCMVIWVCIGISIRNADKAYKEERQ